MHTEKKRGEREKEGEGKEFYSFQYFPGGPRAAKDLWSYPARGPTAWLKILLAKISYVGSTHSPFRHVREAAKQAK